MFKVWSSNESGSMAPLGLGLGALSLAFVLAISAASSLFVFQKRLTNYAEMAAIYVSSQDAAVSDFQLKVGNQNFLDFNLSQQMLEDGITVKITACAKWITPVSSFVSPPATIICSYASARAG